MRLHIELVPQRFKMNDPLLHVRYSVALGAAVGRALRGVRAAPGGRVAVLQRQLVPRAARARRHRPRRRLPAVLRATGH